MGFEKTRLSLLGNFHWTIHSNNFPSGFPLVFAHSLFAKQLPIWKRAMDILGALFGLIFLAPFFLSIALLIKVVSPGPVFFKQKRIGRAGQLFTCLKFRTMVLNADTTVHKDYLTKLINSCQENNNSGDPMAKIDNDSRIIKYGHLLRATGLDELPQLINVLMGHMSLVGPRPPIPYEVEQYQRWCRVRFDVLPGLTGLWQVSGKNKLGFYEMIRLDIQYALKPSFLMDCKILLMTPYAVLMQLIDMQNNRKIIHLNRNLNRR